MLKSFATASSAAPHGCIFAQISKKANNLHLQQASITCAFLKSRVSTLST